MTFLFLAATIYLVGVFTIGYALAKHSLRIWKYAPEGRYPMARYFFFPSYVRGRGMREVIGTRNSETTFGIKLVFKEWEQMVDTPTLNLNLNKKITEYIVWTSIFWPIRVVWILIMSITVVSPVMLYRSLINLIAKNENILRV